MVKYLDNLENITTDLQEYNKVVLLIYDSYDVMSYSVLDMIVNYDEIKNQNLILTNKTNLKLDIINKLNLNYFSQLHISQYYNIFNQINDMNDFTIPYFYFFKDGILIYKSSYNTSHDLNYNMLKHLLLNFFNHNNNFLNFNLLMDGFINNNSISDSSINNNKILKKEEIIKDVNKMIKNYNKTFAKPSKKIEVKNEYNLYNIHNITVYI